MSTTTKPLTAYNDNELMGAMSLLLVFERPINFIAAGWVLIDEAPTPRSDHAIEETIVETIEETEEETEESNAEDIVVDQAPEPPRPWFHNLLDRVPLKTFARFGMRPATLDVEAEQRIEAVLDAMPERSSFQEAVWYLEENEWKVTPAITQYKYDENMRAEDNSEVYQEACRRANTISIEAFEPESLLFRIREAAGVRRYTFPDSENFDINNPGHLRALNHWRADMTRYSGDLPPLPPLLSIRDRQWRAGEERFLRNRYARKKDHYAVGGLPDLASLVEGLNEVVVGRYMPGRINPCAPRTVSSANAWLDRNWKRDDNGNRWIHRQRYASAIKMQRKRDEELVEFARFMSA